MMKIIGYVFLFLITVVGVSFLSTWARQQSSAIDRNERQTQQQVMLRNFADHSTLIDTKLREVLDAVPSAARIRVSMLHQVTDSGSNTSRFDVTNAVSAPGHEPDIIVANAPLSLWNDFMPFLVTKRCYFDYTNNLPDEETRDRLGSRDIRAFIVCPIIGLHTGRLKGAVFLSWDEANAVPADRSDAEARVVALASYIENNQQAVP